MAYLYHATPLLCCTITLPLRVALASLPFTPEPTVIITNVSRNDATTSLKGPNWHLQNRVNVVCSEILLDRCLQRAFRAPQTEGVL